MPTAASSAALNGSAQTLPPAPVSLPLRSLLPPRPIAAVLVAAGAASLAITALRPKQVPKQVQLAADAVTGVTVLGHPVETLFVRRALAKKNLTRGTVRKTTLSSLVFGVFGSVPALRAIRKATR